MSSCPATESTHQPRVVDRVPPVSWFAVSAVFHYLGPSLAVLLFTRMDVLGVAWLRIASAAVVFALWRRPWRILRTVGARQRWTYAALGALLAAMNSLFYLAVDRLPLSTVGAVEFLGVVVLAALGARSARNTVALVCAVSGVVVLTDIRLVEEPWGILFAFGNCVGFMLYVVLGHVIANGPTEAQEQGSTSRSGEEMDDDGFSWTGIDQLGISMIIAAVVATPFGLGAALPAMHHPLWLAWGIGVGLCSSVVPYVTDQLAMARLPRATFALMLSILPATATVVGLVVLAQVPSWRDLLGVALVIVGVALHRDRDAEIQPDRRAARSTPERASGQPQI